MVNIGQPTKYTPPAPVEKPNPYVDALRPIVAQGVDTLFPVEFKAEEYKAEKLLIQNAVRVLGFSAREHETDFADGSDQKTVKSIFRVRPRRKDVKGADGGTAEADAPAEVEAKQDTPKPTPKSDK